MLHAQGAFLIEPLRDQTHPKTERSRSQGSPGESKLGKHGSARSTLQPVEGNGSELKSKPWLETHFAERASKQTESANSIDV